VQTNPYQRYAETNLMSSNPLELVVALYRGALDSVFAAVRFNEAEDHLGRGRAVNKALDIIAELTVSLNVDEGGAVAVQLGELYTYMRGRLVEAHMEKSQVKLVEVATLLSTLLEGWQQIASTNANNAGYGVASAPAAFTASPVASTSLAYA
jgi:flagellar protein FliS